MRDRFTWADLEKIWTVGEMVWSEHILFATTGINNLSMLQGICYEGIHCVTESIRMRTRHCAARRISAYHGMKCETMRMTSEGEIVF